jgi:UDP-GlcNAc:undecaprenyl-phosphate GlcNAc-1-phosphate transferase
VGIVAAFMAGMTGLAVTGVHPPGMLAVMAAAGLMAGVSYMDDVRLWNFAVKLAAQLAATGLVMEAGIWLRVVHLPWVGTVHTGWLGVPLTAAWILFVTNAVNFIDGLNGLASGCVLLACLFLAAAAGTGTGGTVFVPALFLAAGIAGFLPFNYPRARIFMGDVGSQFCGFLLAVLGVAASTLSSPSLSALLMPLLLLPILADVALTLLRRARDGERLTQAHRGHFYQVANRAGMPAWAVTLIYWGLTVWGGVCGLALDQATPSIGQRDVPVIAAFIPFAAWVAYVVRRARIGRWG